MLFKKAVNQSAFLKCGLLGFQGSGKTYTACDIAIGMYKLIKAKKPVFFLDTETGSDWAIPKFKKEGVGLSVSKTRTFKNLLDAISEAEKESSVLIIDSVSHFWTEVMEAYKKAKNIRGRIAFHHWMPIKEEWKKFSDAYVNSLLHIIVCGRAGWQYDYDEDEEGNKDLIKTGTKMKAEGEFGFEPSLLLEMERIRESGTLDGKRVGKIGGKVIHRCHVIKDRRMDDKTMDGMCFDNPIFKNFIPHVEALNLGGEHLGVDTSKSSKDLFESQGESYASISKRKQVLVEEITGVLEKHYPGSGRQEKIAKAAIKKYVFGTYSDTSISDMQPDVLNSGLSAIADLAQDKDTVQQIINDSIESKKKEE